ncbi:MAG: hypothetical protein R2941_22920 [Desulfobacterales bacterium]
MTNADVKFLAKAGMTLSLAALVVTGAGKGYASRQMHTWAGIALVGFSVWHYNAYQKSE